MKIIDINGSQREAKEVAPDPAHPGFMKVQFRRHHEWISIQEFLQRNPNLEHLTKDAPDVPDDVVGVVTSGGKEFLRDSTQNWPEDEYLGMFVWVSRGKGEGQKRTVVSNTKNKITIDQPWEDIPNKTSQYVISYNIKEPRAMGNTLPEEDIKDLERKAIKIDRHRGRLNKEYKYLKPEEVD